MAKLSKRIKKAILKNNPKVIFETAKVLVNKSNTLSSKEKFIVVEMIDDLLGTTLLDLSNEYLVEKKTEFEDNDDVLLRTAKKYFMEAYKRVNNLWQKNQTLL